MKNFIHIIYHKFRSINILIIILFMGFALQAQNFTVAGSDITITDGAAITITGNFEIVSDININNSGDIFIGGNWLNNAPGDLSLAGNSGQLTFNGLSPQLIGGNSRTTFSNLSLFQHTELENETFIANALMLDNAKLTLNKNNLFVQGNDPITGSGAEAYIVTNSEGALIQPVGSSERIFPVGTSQSYLPATLANNGVADNYGISVFPDVLSGGLSGSTIPQIAHCVNSTWNIIEQSAGGSDLTLSLEWNGIDEGFAFLRSQSAIGHFHNDIWNAHDVSFASGNNPYSSTRSAITTTGAFAIGDVDSPMGLPVVYDEQNIFIEQGWSGISSYLLQANPDIEQMLRPISSELVLIQNINGMYWPEQEINSLGNWDTFSGYKIKLSSSVNFTFTGLPITDASLDLAEGWNLIPVLSVCDVDVADLFSQSDVKIVSEVAGIDIYWPEYGINTLGQLESGNAYMVFMANPGELVFPACE